jgi:predicted transcriptional regulator
MTTQEKVLVLLTGAIKAGKTITGLAIAKRLKKDPSVVYRHITKLANKKLIKKNAKTGVITLK